MSVCIRAYITQDIYKKRGKGFFFVLLANSLFLPLPDVEHCFLEIGGGIIW